jgi:hypothetical protein
MVHILHTVHFVYTVRERFKIQGLVLVLRAPDGIQSTTYWYSEQQSTVLVLRAPDMVFRAHITLVLGAHSGIQVSVCLSTSLKV